MKRSDFGVEIVKVENGFLIRNNEGIRVVIEEVEGDEMAAGEKLIWELMEFFGLRNDDFARERVAIVREAGDEYTPADNEEIVEVTYRKVVKKNPRRKGGDKKS